MPVFENPNFDAHEAVHAFYDRASGACGFVAVHSTFCGPAAGGARLWRYANSEDALTDALRLSRGMSYKNAMAGLNLGGGKSVLMHPEGDFDRTAMFTVFGQFLEKLGGQYYTAEDVGVSPNDMKTIHKYTNYVAGLEDGQNASGDPSPVTADGVFRCLRLGVKRKLATSLRGVNVAVQGLGHVGYELCRLLDEAGAKLIVTDINQQVLEKANQQFGAKIVSPDDIYDSEADVLAPCALGAIINQHTIDRIGFSVICGAANNQLAVPTMGQALQARGILYCPDYIVNAGGIINIAGEIEGHYSKAWVEEKLVGIERTLNDVLETAEISGATPDTIADKLARKRIGRG